MLPFECSSSGKVAYASAAIVLLLLCPEMAAARKAEFFDTSITRGRTAAGFYYMHGGFAFEEQQAMERQAAAYNLKLVFAPRLGASISPVLLLIGHNRSHSVDKISLHGPSVYLRLPPGAYTLMARIKKEIVLIRDVYLGERRRTIHFAYGR